MQSKKLKKILIIFSIFFAVLLTTWFSTKNLLHAQDTDETATIPAEKIQKLKEDVATKVAELRKRQKRAVYGTISSIEKDQISLKTNIGEFIFNVDSDVIYSDITAKGESKRIKFSDLQKGQNATIFGKKPLDEDATLAKVVIRRAFPYQSSGIVTNVDIDNGTFTIKTIDDQKIVLDVERYTVNQAFTEDKGIIRWGLSKIENNDRVHIVALQNEKEENRFSTLKILVLPNSLFLYSTSPKNSTPSAVISPTVSESE